MLRAELIEGFENIAAIERQWNAVYHLDPEANYFLSFKWLFGTERGAGQFGFAVAVRDQEAGRYVAFLPIRINTELEQGSFHNELNLCGNFTSDYTGLICEPEHETTAIPLMAAKLRDVHWRKLRLLNLAASDTRRTLFLSAFDESEFEMKPISLMNSDGTNNAVCPYTLLGNDWDEFLTNKVSSNTRQKIRRFLRKVEGSDEYRFANTSRSSIDGDIEILIRLWSLRWAKQKGKRLGAIQASFRRMLRHAHTTGTLYMPALLHKEKVACVHAIFVDREKRAYNFYVGARDQAFGNLPSGLVLHGFAMRKAISEGIEKYDFLRGDEPYKYAFGSQETTIQSIVISTKSKTNIGSKLDPRSLHYVRRRSREFLRDADLKGARRALTQILHTAPDDANSRYLLGMTEVAGSDFGDACETYTRLVRMRPNSLKNWYRLGRAAAAHHTNWNDATAAYSDLLKLPDDQRQIPLLLGRILSRLGQKEFALAILQSAARRDPQDAALQRALASISGKRIGVKGGARNPVSRDRVGNQDPPTKTRIPEEQLAPSF